MSRFTVIYDANVLYPAAARDLLLQLATTGLFRAHWTDAIHEEWMRNVRRDRPDIPPIVLDRTRALMGAAVTDALIVGYESLIEQLALPDPNDRHVLAAAIRANADAIVTFNLRDFPAQALEPYDLEALHPDQFVRLQLDLAPHQVCEAVKTIRARLTEPPYSVDDYLSHLAAAGFPTAAEQLSTWAAFL